MSGIAVGVDGCPGGWIAAVVAGGRIGWRRVPNGQFADLVRAALPALPALAVMAVDMPIGLVDEGWRRCDLLAKEVLGRAHMRVFLTPPREVVHLGWSAPNDQVQRRCRELTGKGISRQALALGPRILEVDSCLPDPRIVEAHPELSFAEMAGRVLASKHRPEGIAERIEVLRGAWAAWAVSPEVGVGYQGDADRLGVSTALDARPAGVPIADALDALAVAWSAGRVLAGVARSTPAQPQLDPRGVPMAILT